MDIDYIHFPFLHNAVSLVKRRYNVEHFKIFSNGSAYITVSGKLGANIVLEIIKTITPKNLMPKDFYPTFNKNYEYRTKANGSIFTVIYTIDNINYIQL